MSWNTGIIDLFRKINILSIYVIKLFFSFLFSFLHNIPLVSLHLLADSSPHDLAQVDPAEHDGLVPAAAVVTRVMPLLD